MGAQIVTIDEPNRDKIIQIGTNQISRKLLVSKELPYFSRVSGIVGVGFSVPRSTA
jgi:hypothetical protein